MSLGEAVRRIRTKELKITLDELSERSGLSKGFLSKIENDKQDISRLDNIRSLANGLDVSYPKMLEMAGYIEEAEKEGLMKSAEEFRKYRERNKLEDIADLNERSFIFDDIISAAYLNTDFIYEGEALERNEKVFIADVLRAVLENGVPLEADERSKVIELIETLLK